MKNKNSISDCKIEEYKLLREEILYVIKAQNLILYAYFIAISIFIPKIIDNFSNSISMTVIIIAYFISHRYHLYIFSMFRTGTYLKIFIEEEFDSFLWETRLPEFYNNLERNKYFKAKEIALSKIIEISALLLICYSLYMNYKIDSCKIIYKWYTYFYIIFIFVFLYEIKNQRKIFAKIEPSWRKVKKKECSENSNSEKINED